MGSLLSPAIDRGTGFASSGGQLCLNQTAYELHELDAGERPRRDDLVLKHLRTLGDIERVRGLRSQIDLSHALGDAQFLTHEKKETN